MIFEVQSLSKTRNRIQGTNSYLANTKTTWYIWFIFAIGLFLIQASTLSLLPTLMQDEAQITDYGRLALDPSSNWSVTWWVAAEKPLFLWSYLGPVLAEVGYQLGGPSGVGPRLMALVGGLVASTMAFGWLLQRKVPFTIAGLLSAAFLLDPLFTLSQRMARSDSWVMALCLASCWLLRRSSEQDDSRKIMLIVISGILAATASFIWPSAVFLYPLICLELFNSIPKKLGRKQSLQEGARHALYFLAGGISICIILILPIRNQLNTILVDMQNMVALNVNASKTPAERLITLFSYQPWAKLVKAFAKTLSFGLPLLSIWALIIRREKGMIVVAFMTLTIIFMTLVYEFRVMYLTPYLLAFSADLFREIKFKPVKPIFMRLSFVFLILVVSFAMGISIFTRSALAFHDRNYHDRNRLAEAATTAIGQGNYKVFLAFSYEFYFTGRSLGWQLYTPYIQFSYDAEGNWIRNNDFKPKDKFVKLMTRMDFAIFPFDKLNEEVKKDLEASGLKYTGTIHVTDKLLPRSSSDLSRPNNILLWFLRGAKGYGPYLLYSRSNTPDLQNRATSLNQVPAQPAAYNK